MSTETRVRPTPGDATPSEASLARRGPYPGLFDLAVALAVLADLYAIFVISPAERIQGDVFRIVYIHVPMGWLAYVAFTLVFGASIAYLWKRRPGADHLARAAAEVGVLFTTLLLVTGVLYGRPVWGVWWTWDARLTTTLVLWFVYVGYLMVRSAIADPERSARIGAVLGVVAFANVPLVQLSVTWWRTLHPTPSVTQPGAMGGTLMPILLFSTAMFAVVFARLVVLRLQLVRAQAEARRLAQLVVERSEA
jgi:heme exporter protein C